MLSEIRQGSVAVGMYSGGQSDQRSPTWEVPWNAPCTFPCICPRKWCGIWRSSVTFKGGSALGFPHCLHLLACLRMGRAAIKLPSICLFLSCVGKRLGVVSSEGKGVALGGAGNLAEAVFSSPFRCAILHALLQCPHHQVSTPFKCQHLN